MCNTFLEILIDVMQCIISVAPCCRHELTADNIPSWISFPCDIYVNFYSSLTAVVVFFFLSQIYSFHGGTIKVCTYKIFFASMTSLHAYCTLVQGWSIRELVLMVSICCGQSLNGMNCWFFDVCYKSCRKVNFIFCNFMSFYKNVIWWGLLFTCIIGALNLFVKIGKVWFTFNRDLQQNLQYLLLKLPWLECSLKGSVVAEADVFWMFENEIDWWWWWWFL